MRVPAHLSPASRRFYRTIADDYGLASEPHALRTLQLACEAWDRCQQARAAVDKEGLTTTTGAGGLKPHPALAVERHNRDAAARLLRELALDGAEFPEVPRLPRIGTGALA